MAVFGVAMSITDLYVNIGLILEDKVLRVLHMGSGKASDSGARGRV